MMDIIFFWLCILNFITNNLITYYNLINLLNISTEQGRQSILSPQLSFKPMRRISDPL